ncbi:galactokinase [Sphingopyxis sp. C-1]|uniref:galactokinase n=1 Tax=Sphingopyxis sp. C-1 TaxID=262667 RepID=UPI0006C67BDF|nr:galactokinase [Sphingopyxis sp. C-1]GAO81033.1 galactokinase [Sphingopyxis sp. C-1]
MSAKEDLVDRVVRGFRHLHGHEPSVIAFAPGRVNLIGEHTDYNDGFALPCAIECGTVVALSPRDDDCIEAASLDLDSPLGSFTLGSAIAKADDGSWENHVRGIAAAMPLFDLPISAANVALAGNIPQGAGLSSSASLGVATALGFAALAGDDAPDRTRIARAAQWAEHHYVGCNCGLMDQLTVAFGEEGKALLIDCRKIETYAVPFPPGTAIMIVHSGVTRGLVDSAYNERRQQCVAASHHYGVAALRDLDAATLEYAKSDLDEISFRRARHVVAENERTHRFKDLMAAGDLTALGRAMRASHASLRDDFDVSLPAIDALVDCLNAAIGAAGGARMTGGGFGGCVVAIFAQGRTSAVEAALAAFWRNAGMAPQLAFLVSPSPGAHLIRNNRVQISAR